MVGAYFVRVEHCALRRLRLRDNNFGCYRITVALHLSVILSCVIDILGRMHRSMSPLVKPWL